MYDSISEGASGPDQLLAVSFFPEDYFIRVVGKALLFFSWVAVLASKTPRLMNVRLRIAAQCVK